MGIDGYKFNKPLIPFTPKRDSIEVVSWYGNRFNKPFSPFTPERDSIENDDYKFVRYVLHIAIEAFLYGELS